MQHWGKRYCGVAVRQWPVMMSSGHGIPVDANRIGPVGRHNNAQSEQPIKCLRSPPFGDPTRHSGSVNKADLTAEVSTLLQAIQADQCVDFIKIFRIDYPIGGEQSEGIGWIDQPFFNGLLLKLADDLVTAHGLRANVRTALTPQAQPDGRGSEQFVGKPEIGHAYDSLRIKHIPITDNRAASAAFAAGETGLTVQRHSRFGRWVRILIHPQGNGTIRGMG